MLATLHIDANRRTPKYLQIANSITKAIKQGQYKKGDRIFSINELSNDCFLSRDTVQKAYDLLEKERIIEAVRGKGFYIHRTDIAVPYRILLILNKLSSYKKIVYDAFTNTLAGKATVEIKIHHSNTHIFDDIIKTSISEYDYYVVMPHFNGDPEEVYTILDKIPSDKLILLDKNIAYPAHNTAVFQDFEQDIYDALVSGKSLLKKYRKLAYVCSQKHTHLEDILTGFKKFCADHGFDYELKKDIQKNPAVRKGEAYIVLTEEDLVQLIKTCQAQQLQVGKEVGIISYNDSPFKEILLGGITVLSTDHQNMGQVTAEMILQNKTGKIKNPFRLIIRRSL